MSRHELARLLGLPDADLDERLTELVRPGYVGRLQADPGEPVPLTETGQRAYDQLYRARHDGVSRLCADWHPDQHPALLALLDRITHQLAASREAPGRDLDQSAPTATAVTGAADTGAAGAGADLRD